MVGIAIPEQGASLMVTVPGHPLQPIADLVEVAQQRIAGRSPEWVRPARIQSDKLFKRGSPKFTVTGAGYTCRDFDMAFICAPVVMFLHDDSVGEHFEQRSGMTCSETLG